MKTDVIVIGSGLFGSMTAKYLVKQGLDVVIIDSVEPMAASKCSFGVWKDGWIEKIQEQASISVPILSDMIGIYEIPYFDMDHEVEGTLLRVDCNDILNEKITFGKVDKVKNKIVTYIDSKGDTETIEANKAVVICAGVWTQFILNKSGYNNFPIVDSYWGCTFDYRGKIDMTRVKQWAPYKQSVAVKVSDNKILFGDGCTVKNPKGDSNDPRAVKAGDRMVEHLHDVLMTSSGNNITSVKEGLRPYLRNGDYVNQHDKQLFSATGGAKNSTVLCGFVAQRIYNLIKKS